MTAETPAAESDSVLLVSGEASREDAARALAAFAATTRFDDLPDAVRWSVKRSLLDTLGVAAAAGVSHGGHDALVRMIERSRGQPESTILGRPERAPAWLAALANGAMARAVDFDDSHDESMTHPSAVVVPAALAVAEREGPVDGRRLATAIAVGNEVLVRLGLAIARRPGGLTLDTWFPTSVFGAFGGTVACGAILGFDAATMRSALGVALFQSSGTLEAFSSSGQRGMMRGMITGFTAMSSTLAASMAEAGIVGVPDALEGEFGLYPVYYRDGYDRATLLADLGSRYESADIGIKPWPTCRYTHAYIDAALQLAAEPDLRTDDIDEVVISVAGYAESRCVPLAAQRAPHNYNHAGHALPFLVALALERRRVTMRDLIEGSRDARVLALAQRVGYRHDPRFSIENKVGPSKVDVRMRDGRVHGLELSQVYGSHARPMPWDAVADKFRTCMAMTDRPPSAGAVELIIECVADLERLTDVRDLMRAFA